MKKTRKFGKLVGFLCKCSMRFFMPRQQLIPQLLEKEVTTSLFQHYVAENSQFKSTIIEYISCAYTLPREERNDAITELKSELERIYAGNIFEPFIKELINFIFNQINKKQSGSDFESMIILSIRLYCQPMYLSADSNFVDTSLIEKDIDLVNDRQTKKIKTDATSEFNQISGSHMLTVEEQKFFIEELFFIDCQINIGKQKHNFDLQTLYQVREGIFGSIGDRIENAINEHLANASLSNVPKSAQPATQLAIKTFDNIQGSQVLSAKDRNKFINKLTISIQKEQQRGLARRSVLRLVSSLKVKECEKTQCLDQINKAIFEEIKENPESKRLLTKYMEQFCLSPLKEPKDESRFNSVLQNTELGATFIKKLLAAISSHKAKTLGIKSQSSLTLQLISRQIDIALLLSNIDGFMKLETTAQIQNIDDINELLKKIQQQQMIIAKLEKEINLTVEQKEIKHTANNEINQYKDGIKIIIKNMDNNVPELNQIRTDNFVNNIAKDIANSTTLLVDYTKYFFPKTMREAMFACYSPLAYITIKSIKDTIVSSIFASHISNLKNYCQSAIKKLFFYYSPSQKAINIFGGKDNAINVSKFFKQKISSLKQEIHMLKKISNMDKAKNLELFLQKLHEIWWKIQTGEESSGETLLLALHADIRSKFNIEIDNMDVTNLVDDLVDLVLPKDVMCEQEQELPRFIGPHREPISYMEKNLRCIEQQKIFKQQGEQIQKMYQRCYTV